MRLVTLAAEDDFDGWRDAVRRLVVEGIAAGAVEWRIGNATGELFGEAAAAASPERGFSVPRVFLDLAEHAALHGDRQRFALLHALLARVVAEPGVLNDKADPLLRRVEALAKAVRRDIHKMRAFVRFRAVEDGDGTRYVAWFEPEHHIVRANAGFFVDRFASMRWSILTPAVSLHWDGRMLSEGPGAKREDAPGDDPAEAVWKSYYASIFNPARLKIGAMLKEMPRRYWRNMPETALVPALIAGAQAREAEMVAKARQRAGDPAGWDALRTEAAHCRRCDLFRHATGTVFGEGPVDARLVFVGEQPGDQEDMAGKPFVGPAGAVFDRALAEAGIDRSIAYVTNAVKHFKYELRGKRRLHQRPDVAEIAACRWWIEQELALIRPELTVALGATAARSLFGRPMTIARERGRLLALPDDAGNAIVTVHPSYMLRLPDERARAEEFDRFVADLKLVGAALRK